MSTSISDLRPILALGVLLATTATAACHFADDEPANDPVDVTATGGGDGAAGCFEVAANQCLPGQNFVGVFEDGDADLVLIDDPAATVGVGPNAWLVQVQSSADWVGTYMYDGGTCTVGCGWCMQGQSLCHGGFDENMYPECPFCFDGDVENPGEQCAEWIAACAPAGPDGGGGGTGADGGGDGTGGADETGGTDPDETSGLEAYDCDAWQPSRAVDLNPGSGTLVVDAELVREIAQHFGDPLTECDDTAFAQLADGHFAIRRTAPNGLLAQLGLRPGDSILALDGKDMSDVDTIANTAVRLFLGKEQTRGFTLTYGRDRAKAQLRIVVR